MATVYGSTAVTLRDYRGYTARVSVWLYSDTDADLVAAAATFATDLIACSNAVSAGQTGLNVGVENTVNYGAASEYPDIGQKLVIRGLDATGRLHRLSIPAPKLAEFLTDQVTMNPAGAAVATLITFLNGAWCSKDGATSPITVIDGSFVDRRRKRKLGTWTRTAIGGPAPN